MNSLRHFSYSGDFENSHGSHNSRVWIVNNKFCIKWHYSEKVFKGFNSFKKLGLQKIIYWIVIPGSTIILKSLSNKKVKLLSFFGCCKSAITRKTSSIEKKTLHRDSKVLRAKWNGRLASEHKKILFFIKFLVQSSLTNTLDTNLYEIENNNNTREIVENSRNNRTAWVI